MTENLKADTGPEKPDDSAGAVAATNSLIESLREKQQEEERAPVTFEAPESARTILTAEELEYSKEFDRLDATRPFHPDLRSELARKGLRPTPTAEEVEDQEQRKLSQLRQHAQSVHQPRTGSTKVLWRPKGSIQRDTADNDPKVKTDRELRGDA